MKLTGHLPSLNALCWALDALLFAALAYWSGAVAALLLERYLEQATPPERQAVRVESARTPKARRPLPDFQSILDVNMFKADRMPQGIARPRAPEAPAAAVPLQLELTGTFVAAAGSYAMVIHVPERIERLYRVGECVPQRGDEPSLTCQPGQAALQRIDGDRITLLHNGQPVVVRLSEKELETLAAPAPGRQLVPEPPERPESQPASGTGAVFPATRTGNRVEVRVPGAEVAKAFENFTDILKQARVVPFTQQGETPGFQIRSIQPGSVFARLGLENNDVIQAVNGESLNNADQALRLFTLFRNEREVRLDVRRRNESLQLNYSIQ
ncbi:MAG: hypothetical protein HY423_01610 [Candidatus Lambdaproteobacteria bacterium]|nr:hypothetical protein [Candidatus Lambdaproteobacteria bacterium]